MTMYWQKGVITKEMSMYDATVATRRWKMEMDD